MWNIAVCFAFPVFTYPPRGISCQTFLFPGLSATHTHMKRTRIEPDFEVCGGVVQQGPCTDRGPRVEAALSADSDVWASHWQCACGQALLMPGACDSSGKPIYCHGGQNCLLWAALPLSSSFAWSGLVVSELHVRLITVAQIQHGMCDPQGIRVVWEPAPAPNLPRLCFLQCATCGVEEMIF